MTKMNKLNMALAVAGALLGSSAAQAEIGYKAGQWDLSFGGNVNGFATRNACDDKPTQVNGGLVCNRGTLGGVGATGGEPKAITAVESGLLPSALVFAAKSEQMGFDVGVTIGLYPTLRTTPIVTGPTNKALGDSAINVRQNFLTFGQKNWGTVKIGRDLGLFGGEGILADMTLLGVGSGAAILGGQTTLGRIGIGYIYPDWIPQITYTTPNWNGFQLAAGVFQGLDIVPFSGTAGSVGLTGHDIPGFQAKATYDWAVVAPGKIWADFMIQKVKNTSASLVGGLNAPSVQVGRAITGFAWDAGAKASYGGLEGVIYGYSGKGVGTTAIGFDAIGVVGNRLFRRTSAGGYAQASYKLGSLNLHPYLNNLKVGVSYGRSGLGLGDNEPLSGNNATLVRENKSSVLGLYYSLTKSVNLVGEYIQTRAKGQDHDRAIGQGLPVSPEIKDNAFALGAIFFF